MTRTTKLGLLLLLPFLVVSVGGCSAISSFTPPDWAYFDVVLYPAGGVPATLGYYTGVAVWSPVAFILGGLMPYPIDEAMWAPGEGIGIVLGFALGLPFHILALPFRWFRGEGVEEPPPPPARPAEPVAAPEGSDG